MWLVLIDQTGGLFPRCSFGYWLCVHVHAEVRGAGRIKASLVDGSPELMEGKTLLQVVRSIVVGF